MTNVSVRFASTDIEYFPAWVSIDSSEFENGRTKTHLQTAAVHSSLLQESVIRRYDDNSDSVTATVKPCEHRSIW